MEIEPQSYSAIFLCNLRVLSNIMMELNSPLILTNLYKFVAVLNLGQGFNLRDISRNNIIIYRHQTHVEEAPVVQNTG